MTEGRVRTMKPNYRLSQNIGKARYVVSLFDGTKFHPDGSPFYDIKILSNRREVARFTRSLDAQGYVAQ